MSDGPNRRTATTLTALVISCWATVAGALDEFSTPCAPCQEPNGRGIYINREADYCLTADDDRNRFCPEAFVQKPDRVELKGRRFPAHGDPTTNKEYVESYVLSAYIQQGPTKRWTPVTLTAVTTTGPRLSFRYKFSNGTVGEASGEKLHKLRLTFSQTNQGLFRSPAQLYFVEKMTLSSDKGPGSSHGLRQRPTLKPVYWYEGVWDLPDPPSPPDADLIVNRQKLFCPDKNKMVLLPGKRVDGQTGKVINDQADNEPLGTVTMACATGAIATCMEWGYNPGAISFADDVENRLLGACIQAKRAAYYGKSGKNKSYKFESYTVDGKKLNIKDREGVLNFKPEPLEAVWTEDGALCFNEAKRRASNVELPKLQSDEKPPACGTQEVVKWFEQGGILATGQHPQ